MFSGSKPWCKFTKKFYKIILQRFKIAHFKLSGLLVIVSMIIRECPNKSLSWTCVEIKPSYAKIVIGIDTAIFIYFATLEPSKLKYFLYPGINICSSMPQKFDAKYC